jgi:hypothetical protein
VWWVPEEAEILIAQDGRSWITPTSLHCREDLAVCRIAYGNALKRIYPVYPRIVSLDGEVGNSTRAKTRPSFFCTM